MSLDNLNKWLTLLANVGVFAGIIFLAIELQQNTNMMRAQTRGSITENTNSALITIAGDIEAAGLIARAFTGELEPGPNPEWMQFSALAQILFRNAENEYYQFEQGLFEDSEYDTRLETLRFNLRSPGFRQVWAVFREQYSESFRRMIDQMVLEIEAD